MKKKLKNSLLGILSLLTVSVTAVACKTSTTEKGPDYNFTYDQPLRAECDSFMNIDGKLDEEAWKNQNYLYWVGGRNNEIKATTLFTSKGLYVGAYAEDSNVIWANRHAYSENTRFKIQVVKEDEINYENNLANVHPTKQFWFDIDAKTSLSRMERQYDAASDYDGELNGETSHFSVELFLPWSEMGYVEEELNAAGVPNAVKLLIQYWTPSGASGFPGFSDDNKFSTYYTYDANGSTCKVERYSEDDTLGYSQDGWTPGDKWIIDQDAKTATNTADRTQMLWFRKDVNGNADSSGTHYIASVKVKAIKKQSMYPHVGLITLASKTMFNIYGVGTDGLTSGKIIVSAARATDGGQWVASKNFSYTYSTNYAGLPEGSDLLPEGMQLAADEIYLTVVKRGGELYYFINGEYIGMEYDERVSGECVIGIFANGQTTVSDWSFEDYTEKTAALDEYLNKFLWFVSGKDNGGGYAVIDKLVAKQGEEVNIKLTSKPGYVLSELTFTENGEESDKLDLFLSESSDDATLTYEPNGNLHVEAVFKKLPNEGKKEILFAITESGETDYLLGTTYTIRGNDKRFVYSGVANNKGFITGSLMQAGTYSIAGEDLTVDGNYTIEISCNGYKTKTFTFNVADLNTVDNKNPKPNMIFALEAYPYTDVKVNGFTAKTADYDFYTYADPTVNEFVTKEQGSCIAYMKDGVYTGDFLFDASISLVDDALYPADDPTNGWRLGAVVGYVLSTGKYYLEMKTAAWEKGKLCLNFNGTEIALDNFPTSTGNFRAKGDQWDILVARYNGVIYVYNCYGRLGFMISQDGITLVNSSTEATAEKMERLNEDLGYFFAVGNEMAIGMYRRQTTEGGGVYQYNFTHTDDEKQIDAQFSAMNIQLKDGESYSLSVESDYKVDGGYLKDTNVTVVFTNVPQPTTCGGYILALDNGVETSYQVGEWNSENGVFKTTFALNDNVEVWLEEYAFGNVTANGIAVKTQESIEKMTLSGNNSWTNDVSDIYTINQYYFDKVVKGDYVIDATITTVQTNWGVNGNSSVWTTGGGFGVILSAGGDNWIKLFANAWEGGMFIQTLGTGNAAIRVTGAFTMDPMKVAGDAFRFFVIRLDNVIYVYNATGNLVFHIDKDGLTVDNQSCSITHTGSENERLVAAEKDFASFFAAGDENAIGMARLNGSGDAFGSYTWKVEVKKGTNEATTTKNAFENRITTASSVTVNGATVEGNEKVAVYDPITGGYAYSQATNGLIGFIPNADGTAMVADDDYVLRVKMQANSGETEFRIYSSESDYIRIKTGVDNHSNAVLYLRYSSDWYSETRIGYNVNAFVNLDGNGGWLDLTIVRYDNAIYVYAYDYIDETTGQAAKYETWQLIFSYKAGVATVNENLLTQDAWGNQFADRRVHTNLLNGLGNVLNAKQNAFAISSVGATSQYIIEVDDTDSAAADFVKNPPAVSELQ